MCARRLKPGCVGRGFIAHDEAQMLGDEKTLHDLGYHWHWQVSLVGSIRRNPSMVPPYGLATAKRKMCRTGFAIPSAVFCNLVDVGYLSQNVSDGVTNPVALR